MAIHALNLNLRAAVTSHYEWDDRFHNGILVFHRDKVPWAEAPQPRRWHRCQVQTYIFMVKDGLLHMIKRCPCGAYKTNFIWRNKNSRKGENH